MTGKSLALQLSCIGTMRSTGYQIQIEIKEPHRLALI